MEDGLLTLLSEHKNLNIVDIVFDFFDFFDKFNK